MKVLHKPNATHQIVFSTDLGREGGEYKEINVEVIGLLYNMV